MPGLVNLRARASANSRSASASSTASISSPTHSATSRSRCSAAAAAACTHLATAQFRQQLTVCSVRCASVSASASLSRARVLSPSRARSLTASAGVVACAVGFSIAWSRACAIISSSTASSTRAASAAAAAASIASSWAGVGGGTRCRGGLEAGRAGCFGTPFTTSGRPGRLFGGLDIGRGAGTGSGGAGRGGPLAEADGGRRRRMEGAVLGRAGLRRLERRRIEALGLRSCWPHSSEFWSAAREDRTALSTTGDPPADCGRRTVPAGRESPMPGGSGGRLRAPAADAGRRACIAMRAGEELPKSPMRP